MNGPAASQTKKIGPDAGAVLCGVLSALLAVFTLRPAAGTVDLFDDLGGTPFFLFAMIPLLSALFFAKPRGGLIACLVASGCALLGLRPATAGFFAAADILPALAACFFAWRIWPVLATQTRDDDAEGNWLAFLAIYAAAIYLAFYARLADMPGGLTGAIVQAMTANADQAFASFHAIEHQDAPADMVEALHRAIPQVAPVIPAALTASWMLLHVFALAVAQRLAPKALRTVPVFVFQAMRVPGWVVFLTAGTGLLAVATPAPYSVIGANLAIITGLPYLFAGLAVIHARAARLVMPRLVLAVFYTFIGLMPYLALLVALIGLLDEWFDFRNRKPAAPTNS